MIILFSDIRRTLFDGAYVIMHLLLKNRYESLLNKNVEFLLWSSRWSIHTINYLFLRLNQKAKPFGHQKPVVARKPSSFLARSLIDIPSLFKFVDWILKDHVHIPGVNFINILRTNFSYECRFGSFFW